MSNKNLFEAFLWIEPVIEDSYKTSRVVWHYPKNVSSVTNEFNNIPQFCFPDLEKVEYENANDSKAEQYIFVLTNKNGDRVYGICFRNLFRGENRRYDVKERVRHCLCFITRFPYFVLFHTLLYQIHSLTLLEKSLELPYKLLQNIYAMDATEPLDEFKFTQSETNSLFHIQNPSTSRIYEQQKSTIINLLDSLGIEKFLLILSAILSESRVVFIADDVNRLSSSILALVSLLNPFQWEHVLIPLLPSKLLSYLSAPVPYIIGVRRYLLQALYKESLDDVLIVDLDTNECRTLGSPIIHNILGEKHIALLNPMDPLISLRSGVANFFNINQDASSIDEGDVVGMLLFNLKSVLSSKPTGVSFKSVASGILGLPKDKKQLLEESLIKWARSSEAKVRDAVFNFYHSLFSDMNKYVQAPNSPKKDSDISSKSSKKSKVKSSDFATNDIRSTLDLEKFLLKRSARGDSDELISFLQTFVKTYIFGRYCENSLENKSFISSISSSKLKDVDLSFHQLVMDWTSGLEWSDTLKGSNDLKSMYYTSLGNHSLPAHIFVSVCNDARNSDHLSAIQRTVFLRLNNCLNLLCSDSSAVSGQRALLILEMLLIHGPNCILSYSLDFILTIRQIIRICNKKTMKSSSEIVGLHAVASSVLTLLLDHVMLSHQRRYFSNDFGFLKCKIERHTGKLTQFGKMHKKIRPENLVEQNGIGELSLSPKESNKRPVSSPSLLDDLNDDARFRIISHDTGDVYDLREIDKLNFSKLQL